MFSVDVNFLSCRQPGFAHVTTLLDLFKKRGILLLDDPGNVLYSLLNEHVKLLLSVDSERDGILDVPNGAFLEEECDEIYDLKLRIMLEGELSVLSVVV